MRIAASALILLALNTGSALANETSDPLLQVLETSQRDKRGVTLYLNGVTLGGGVVRSRAATPRCSRRRPRSARQLHPSSRSLRRRPRPLRGSRSRSIRATC